jgi:hypothetical protein
MPGKSYDKNNRRRYSGNQEERQRHRGKAIYNVVQNIPAGHVFNITSDSGSIKAPAVFSWAAHPWTLPGFDRLRNSHKWHPWFWGLSRPGEAFV